MVPKVVGKFPGGSYVRKKLEKRDFHHPESAQSVPAVADSGLCDHLPERHLSAAILAVSCLTDMIDGKIARKFHMISNLGKILDPVADKATQFTLIICLAVKHPALWYLVGLFIIKEGFQAIAGMILLRSGRILKGALITGKVCTTVLFISLIALVLLPELSENIVRWIVLFDSLFMWVAFVDYILAFSGKKSKFENLNEDPNPPEA